MKIFALRDSKAEAFNTPFTSANAATAMRQLQSGIQENPMLRDFAMDYTLYEIGLFDQETGRITPSPDPYHVVDVAELLKGLEPEPAQLTGVA